MGLRHGFKTEANRLAVALRLELELDEHAPICPWQLAQHLSIPISTLSDLTKLEPSGVQYLTQQKRDVFSAVTIFGGRHGRKRFICHNDAHAVSRQAANLAHELAHAILCHPPTPPFAPDPIAEEEAKWLGPTLLIPNEAALYIIENEMPLRMAQAEYGVSEALLNMRLNLSGARIRVQRRENR